MTTKFFLLILLFSPLSYAGENWFEKGNGGFVVLCDQKPPQTLDLYETGQHQWTLDKKYASDVTARVFYLIQRLDAFNFKRSLLYYNWAASFHDEAEFTPNSSFGPLPDLGYVRVDEGCKLQQVIYQRQPNALKKYRYTVNSTIWNTLSKLDQAALIMHELIYREFALPPSSHLTSESSRYFNSWINSEEFGKATIQNYLEMLQNLNVVKAEYKNYNILLAVKNELQNSWSYANLNFMNGQPRFLVLDASEPLETKQISLKPLCQSKDKLTSYGEASLEADGSLRAISPLHPSMFRDLVENCPGEYYSDIFKYHVYADYWIFGNPTGRLSYATRNFKDSDNTTRGPFSNSDFEVSVGASRYPLRASIHFAESGEPDSLEFLGEACLRSDKNKPSILLSPLPSSSSTTWSLSDPRKILSTLKSCE